MTGRHQLATVVAAALLLTGCGQGTGAPATDPATAGRSAGSGSAATTTPTDPDGTEATPGSVAASPDPDGSQSSEGGPAAPDDPAETTAPQDPLSLPAPEIGEPGAPPALPPVIETGAPADAAPRAEAPTGPGEPAGYSSAVSEIDAPLAARMASSWRSGCPVPLADLRYLTVTYRGFDGADHTGELVVASAVTADVATIFGELYAAGYPIASMRLVDDFGGSDDASMAANNTSAFNCRPVTGGGGYAEHSYGTAIDLNPVQNPYVSGALVLPEQGRAHTNRTPERGVIQSGDAVVAAFAASGWSWGGNWSGPVDYQHFSVSGR